MPTTMTTSGLRQERASRMAGIALRTPVALLLACVGALAILLGIATQRNDAPTSAVNRAQNVSYDNYRESAGPWSIHVVRVPRVNTRFELSSMHADGKAVGLTSVTDQAALFNSKAGIPVAAINGDFYQREGPYAGDPRGLQIVRGELISAPKEGVTFCVDLIGEPHLMNAVSLLQVTWPNGSSVPLGLNESRLPDRIALYTPSLGPSTRATGGRELVLEQNGNREWLPLRAGRMYRARVREIRESGNTPILPDTMVLSVGPAAVRTMPRIETGMELSISTAIEPSLTGIKTAISGGPVLAQKGKRLRFKPADSESYEFSSMLERHPRSAIGWNDDFFFLVAVDGRQKGVSEGMTLNELASYLVQLGCREAMNLDGGGSATLWYEGKVRNYLCDGYEREVANSLIVHRKPTADTKRTETPPDLQRAQGQ